MGKMARRICQIGSTMGKMIQNVFFEGHFFNRAIPTGNPFPNFYMILTKFYVKFNKILHFTVLIDLITNELD